MKFIQWLLIAFPVLIWAQFLNIRAYEIVDNLDIALIFFFTFLCIGMFWLIELSVSYKTQEDVELEEFGNYLETL